MAIIDLVVIGFLVLMALIGLLKGLSGTFLGITSFLVTIVVSVILSPIVGQALQASSVGDASMTFISEKLSAKMGDAFDATISVTDGVPYVTIDGDTVKLSEMIAEKTNLPEPIISTAVDMVDLADADGLSVENKIVPPISLFLLDTLSCIAMMIIFSIIFRLISNLFDKILENPVARKVDKLMGMAVFLVLAVSMIWGVFYFSEKQADGSNVFSAYIVEPAENSSVAKILYENNLLGDILGSEETEDSDS